MNKGKIRDGFFTMIALILIVLIAVIYLAYQRVKNAS